MFALSMFLDIEHCKDTHYSLEKRKKRLKKSELCGIRRKMCTFAG
jgi:hypothetical protein